MTDYATWAAKHPQAAAELQQMLGAIPWPATEITDGKSEAWAQQRDRMTIAREGGMAWRNNVGATPAKCPDCHAPQRPVRYGLANDSARLNQRVKSSDLVAIIPRLITPAMVGTTIGQFAAIEDKKPGWKFRPGDEHEQAQLAFLALVRRMGGYATFSTGELSL